jgi:hypothetical protein
MQRTVISSWQYDSKVRKLKAERKDKYDEQDDGSFTCKECDEKPAANGAAIATPGSYHYEEKQKAVSS